MTPSHPMKPRLPQSKGRPASTRGHLANGAATTPGRYAVWGTCERSAGAKPSEAMAPWHSALCSELRRATRSWVSLSLDLPHACPATGS